jgi:pre-mRNA-splicing helicase BRR2
MFSCRAPQSCRSISILSSPGIDTLIWLVSFVLVSFILLTPVGQSPPEIGELIGIPNAGRLVHRLVHSFPKLQYVISTQSIESTSCIVFRLQAQVQPITRSLLRIDLSIIPDFRWDEKVHGTAETFMIVVEDVDGEVILFHDSFVLRQRYAEDEHNVTLTVPMFEPVPPNYYISIISDRWLHAETRLPISFKHLILPEKFPSPTPLLDLQSLPLSALHNKEFEAIYSSTIQTFNKIQTQVFQALYTSDENVFIGAPTGSGKTICAEFALLRLWSKREQPRAVCIEPYQEMVDQRVKEWQAKFSKLQGGKEIVSLTGETSADLRLLEKGDVIVCTPTQVSPRLCHNRFHLLIDFLCSGMSFLAAGANERMSKTLASSLLMKYSLLAVKLVRRTRSSFRVRGTYLRKQRSKHALLRVASR